MFSDFFKKRKCSSNRGLTELLGCPRNSVLTNIEGCEVYTWKKGSERSGLEIKHVLVGRVITARGTGVLLWEDSLESPCPSNHESPAALT